MFSYQRDVKGQLVVSDILDDLYLLRDNQIKEIVKTMTEDEKKYCKLFHLDYMNNYLTLDTMLEDYNLTVKQGNYYLMVGRYLNK